jgi:hypothetical protein
MKGDYNINVRYGDGMNVALTLVVILALPIAIMALCPEPTLVIRLPLPIAICKLSLSPTEVRILMWQ